MTTLPEPRSAYPPYAGFILRGKELDPQTVTEMLGILPHKSFKKGDKRKDSKTWPHGLWMITSSDEIDDLDLTSHIKWLLDRLEPIETALMNILANPSIEGLISCFWIMPTSHESLILDSDLIQRLATLHVRMELDIYSSD